MAGPSVGGAGDISSSVAVRWDLYYLRAEDHNLTGGEVWKELRAFFPDVCSFCTFETSCPGQVNVLYSGPGWIGTRKIVMVVRAVVTRFPK